MSTPTVMVRTADGRHALQHLSGWGTVTDLAGDELGVCPRSVRVCGSGLPMREWWALSLHLGGGTEGRWGGFSRGRE